MLTYITANNDKIFFAKKGLLPQGITFETKALELIEIQSSSIEEITHHKAKQAFAILGTPVFVTDEGWSIPALNGFPGAYMKYMNEWLSPHDYLHLMESHSNKTIIKSVALCYADSKNTRCFTATYEGEFINSIQGNGFSAMRVVSMTSDGKSVAECIEQGINPFNDSSFWKEFGMWYKNLA